MARSPKTSGLQWKKAKLDRFQERRSLPNNTCRCVELRCYQSVYVLSAYQAAVDRRTTALDRMLNRVTGQPDIILLATIRHIGSEL